MTLGERIKTLRMNQNITQEMLAEKLSVSRSAIAKWEADGGVPEIGNLTMIAKLFHVSLDYVVNGEEAECETAKSETKHGIVEAEESYCDSECIGKWCDIDLNGWNDGATNLYIVAEDKDFFFYKRYEEERSVLGKLKIEMFRGAVGKKYITSLKEISVKQSTILEEKSKLCILNEKDMVSVLDRNYFVGKNVTIELAKKDGIIAAFLDFRDADYTNVIIKTINDGKVRVNYGHELDTASITKIEEIV